MKRTSPKKQQTYDMRRLKDENITSPKRQNTVQQHANEHQVGAGRFSKTEAKGK